MQTPKIARWAQAMSVPMLALPLLTLSWTLQPWAHGIRQEGDLIVIVEDYAFIPAFVTVSVGTTAIWSNRDPELHTITSDEELFDGWIGPNETFSITFHEPGVFFYSCVPHDWMIGEITVVGTATATPHARSS